MNGDSRDKGLSEARTEEDLGERDYIRRDITITIREVPGEFVKVQIGASKPIYKDELKRLWKAVETTLVMVGIDRPSDPDPVPKITIDGIRRFVKEEEARKKILDESLEEPPESDRDPARTNLMTEEELILDFAERHAVDAPTVKFLRENAQAVLNAATLTKGKPLPPEVEKEIISQGAGYGIPETTVLALVEDLIDTF